MCSTQLLSAARAVRERSADAAVYNADIWDARATAKADQLFRPERSGMLCRERNERDIRSCLAIAASAFASHALNARRSSRYIADDSRRRRPINSAVTALHVLRARRRPVARRLLTATRSDAWNSRDCSAASIHEMRARCTLGERKLLRARATARRSSINARHVFQAARCREPSQTTAACSSRLVSDSLMCLTACAMLLQCRKHFLRAPPAIVCTACSMIAMVRFSSDHVRKAFSIPSPRNAEPAARSCCRANARSSAKLCQVFNAERSERFLNAPTALRTLAAFSSAISMNSNQELKPARSPLCVSAIAPRRSERSCTHTALHELSALRIERARGDSDFAARIIASRAIACSDA